MPSPVMGQAVGYKVFAPEDSDILIPNRNKPTMTISPKRVREDHDDDIDSESNYSRSQTPEEPKFRKTYHVKGSLSLSSTLSYLKKEGVTSREFI